MFTGLKLILWLLDIIARSLQWVESLSIWKLLKDPNIEIFRQLLTALCLFSSLSISDEIDNYAVFVVIGVGLMASNIGSSTASTPLATVVSSPSSNSPIDVMAVIQRATAEAAALSSRHTAVSGSSGVAQKTAIVKQPSLNFNSEVS